MAKMTEYTAATRFDSGDILIKDGTNGTKKIAVANAAQEFAGLVSAMQHRNVYREKNLGTTITAAFDAFSPVAIVETKAGVSGVAAAGKSPKTSEAAPVAVLFAVACLGGAAFCAKRVRYNK